ncbi:glycosyltransferase [bacterium]|nr:glycosyltransferase [bacterium]
MNVGIIIPSFNHFEYVHLACESAANTPGAVVIVIDDASPQWPGDRIVRGYLPPTVPFVIRRYDRNAGLSRSWNAGLRICRDMDLPYAVCGNSDLVFSEEWWAPMEEALKIHDFAGPLTNAPGHVNAQNVANYLNDYDLSDDPDDINATARELRSKFNHAVPRSMINGFCIAGKTDAFLQLSSEPFDPSIPLAGNEDDFFDRAKERYLKTCIVPSSFVFHYRSVTRRFHHPERGRGAVRLPSCEACLGRAKDKLGGPTKE